MAKLTTQKTRSDAARSHTDVGHQLRAVRKERGFSLGQVAEATGVSRSFLSLVETGRSDITLGRLMRLVQFYEIRISDLLPEPPTADPRVVRVYERKRISSPGEGIDVFLLARDTDRLMMPIISVFEPGGENTEHNIHAGEEFVHVIEGALMIELAGEERIILREGDSAYYEADRPHRLRNIADGTTRLLEVLSPPTF
jgi:transcriptional regulator with XRE-family HTH domain